jgi:hypothetical protein
MRWWVGSDFGRRETVLDQLFSAAMEQSKRIDALHNFAIEFQDEAQNAKLIAAPLKLFPWSVRPEGMLQLPFSLRALPSRLVCPAR